MSDAWKVDVQQLITDLDSARWDGTIYTYGQIQARLREVLEVHAEGT